MNFNSPVIHKQLVGARRKKLLQLNLGLSISSRDLKDDEKDGCDTKDGCDVGGSAQPKAFNLPTPNVNPFRPDFETVTQTNTKTCQGTSSSKQCSSSNQMSSDEDQNDALLPPTTPRQFMSPPTVAEVKSSRYSLPDTPAGFSLRMPRMSADRKSRTPGQFGASNVRLQPDKHFRLSKRKVGLTHNSVLNTSTTKKSRFRSPKIRSTAYRATAQHVSRYVHDFEQIDIIASGNFGRVTRCRQRVDGMEYAIKRIPASNQLDKQSKIIANKEIFALSALETCPNIVRYFQSWVEDGFIYIQLELCDKSLHSVIQAAHGRYFTETQVVDVLRQVNIGLHHLHSHDLVHLDIKPENILVRSDVYKIGDLGMVTRVGGPNQHDYREEGDVRFIARELLQDNRDHLNKADMFSLGASIYSMMVSRDLPRSGSEWTAIRDGRLRIRSMYAQKNSKSSAWRERLSMSSKTASALDTKNAATPHSKLVMGQNKSYSVEKREQSGQKDEQTQNSCRKIVAETNEIRHKSLGHDDNLSREDTTADQHSGEKDINSDSWPIFSPTFVRIIKMLMHSIPLKRPSTSDLKKLMSVPAVPKNSMTKRPGKFSKPYENDDDTSLAAAKAIHDRKFSSGFSIPQRAPLRRSETL